MDNRTLTIVMNHRRRDDDKNGDASSVYLRVSKRGIRDSLTRRTEVTPPVAMSVEKKEITPTQIVNFRSESNQKLNTDLTTHTKLPIRGD